MGGGSFADVRLLHAHAVRVAPRTSVRCFLKRTGCVVLVAIASACASSTGELDLEEHLAAVGALDQVPLEEERMVTVAGRGFATRCAGEGSHTVMLVAGQDTQMTTWDAVQPAIGSVVRVCAYDRLGIGNSHPTPREQTLDGMADDLDGVIRALDLQRPITVVGHSLGAAVALTWATEHPQDIRGLVLVDSASARFVERAFQLATGLDEPLASPLLVDALQRASDDGIDNPESLDLRASWTAFADLPDLGEVPLVVLTHGRDDAISGFGSEAVPELEMAWQEAQRDLAARSRSSQLYSAEDAGHFIQEDRPELVLAAVLAVME